MMRFQTTSKLLPTCCRQFQTGNGSSLEVKGWQLYSVESGQFPNCRRRLPHPHPRATAAGDVAGGSAIAALPPAPTDRQRRGHAVVNTANRK